MLTKQNLIKFGQAFSALILLFAICKLMLMGAGVSNSERNIFLFCILIMLCNASRKIFYYFIIPLAFIYSLYTPIGLHFGGVSYQYLASVLATDLGETSEFFSQIPIKNYFLALLIIPGLLLFRWMTVQYKLYFYKNKTVLIIFIIFALLKQEPFRLFNDFIQATQTIQAEIQKLKQLKQHSAWGKSTLKNSNYDNYVVIIGESARKDYHHAYGYPVNNTPFMSQANGILVDGLTSAGKNTVASLRLMLTQPDNQLWEPHYGNNMIDLINSAQIKTYWLSNQGYLGEHDTPISAIAEKSNHQYFIKSGSYESMNSSDLLLLPKLADILKSNPKGKKFIVLHLYGSHPEPCARVEDYPLIFNNIDRHYSDINCYVTSIKQTDELLAKVHQILFENQQKNNASFSMLYFSDHGLSTGTKDDKVIISQANYKALHHDIPLFMTSSDSTTRRQCKSFKSGLNFTNGIASWVGISNPQLPASYSLFDCKDDPNDYGLGAKLKNKEADPAINLHTKISP